MGLHRQEVMQRRAALLDKIAGQRQQIADAGTRLQPVFQVADQAVLAGRFLAAHPVPVAGVVGLLLLRRKGLMGLFKSARSIWRTYRYFGEVSRRLGFRL